MKQVSARQATGRHLPVAAAMGLVVLRMAVGWHFLYEGVVKLIDPGWSSYGYLATSQGFASDVFRQMTEVPETVQLIDALNIAGLIFIGLGLLFGFLTRFAAFFGAVLLAMYYLAHPPFAGNGVAEGSYLIIDKNLVEFFAMVVLMLKPSGRIAGIDGLLADLWARRQAKRAEAGGSRAEMAAVPRRALLKHFAAVPVAGGFAYAFAKKAGVESFEELNLLLRRQGEDVAALSGATLKTFEKLDLADLRGTVPMSTLGNLQMSRMILGGNLIGGWAHARDLIYVSDLVKAYHHDQKVFETFRLAEACGMNTIITNPQLNRVINDYWKNEGGKIQYISDCAYQGDVIEGIKLSLEGGAHACYVQGGIADVLVQKGDLDTIAKGLDLIRQNGLTAGIGAHKLGTVQACVERGLKPDFWMKTLHKVDYWSARVGEEERDNIWCEDPDATIAYMESLPEPWIAFKILAAGAYHPSAAFSYAFQSGADFICVGMYDFQLVQNVNLVVEALNGVGERRRPWRTETLTV